MHPALRIFLCVTAALSLLWSANAQAVPFGSENNQSSEYQNRGRGHGHGRGHDRHNAITRSARSAPFALTISHRGRGDACDRSFWGCVRSRRVQSDAEAPRNRGGHRGWTHRRLAQLRNHLRVAIEPVPVRPGTRPTSPIPEPQAALVFMVGIGIVATRIRRS